MVITDRLKKKIFFLQYLCLLSESQFNHKTWNFITFINYLLKPLKLWYSKFHTNSTPDLLTAETLSCIINNDAGKKRSASSEENISTQRINCLEEKKQQQCYYCSTIHKHSKNFKQIFRYLKGFNKFIRKKKKN